MLTEVCQDTHVESQLQPLSRKTFSEKTANKLDQARGDVSARGFWLTGQVAFFDVRAFNPTAKPYVNHDLRKLYKVNEKKKKKKYNEHILQIEYETFNPLVMGCEL